ncbi:MAG TPA: ABC transporter substrate-binding protein [Candidatus Caccovicinus merdipullorum]|uniref:ABC transporter substrate-binding protein n=1 Tax=Candidatus Caccovicinus merdipullorum TaxID=2840724 RepID=A0A9D1GKC0_9FIRM|nr:ABC transporter substrate-binding protein [Candidatus Caccovicinus merdipullorum]
MKKTLSYLLAGVMATMMLGGCGASSSGSSSAAETTAETAAETEAASSETNAPETEAETENPAAETEGQGEDSAEAVSVRVGSLKGPTSMGLVYLMDMDEKGTASNDYEFTMVTAADELLPQVINGNLDIALVPANVASTLYNKTQGQISVIDINTLGVLYAVSGDSSIKSFSDLKGKTVYMTGKGTTPDYVFRYLLNANGMADGDLTLEYKSEAAEVAALLKEQPDAVGILPQPFVTVACTQNENLGIVLDLTKEWDAIQTESGSQLVTGVTVVRNEFLSQHPEAVDSFLTEHAESVAYVNENPAQAAELVVKTGIIEKAPIAEKALPYCNITCITGSEMQAALSGYLEVLFDQDPASVGGALPGDDFYYAEKAILLQE